MKDNNRKIFGGMKIDKYYKPVRPDIVISKANRIIIIDTKWKMVEDNDPADDDLKQMFVYNLLWDAEKSLLLYPGNFNSCNGSYPHFTLSMLDHEKKENDFYNHCSLAFLNLLDKEGKLVSNEPFEELLASL